MIFRSETRFLDWKQDFWIGNEIFNIETFLIKKYLFGTSRPPYYLHNNSLCLSIPEQKTSSSFSLLFISEAEKEWKKILKVESWISRFSKQDITKIVKHFKTINFHASLIFFFFFFFFFHAASRIIYLRNEKFRVLEKLKISLRCALW